jgi:heme-degrading monooxygenase HmoA
MVYMLCKHGVQDFAKWHSVFSSHAEAQRKAGLHLLYLLRNVDDPSHVVYLFRVDDLETAKAFTETSDASKAGQESGVIGVPEIILLHD